MSKPARGIKRVCQSCGARFYDLGRTPIVCPSCQAVYQVTQPTSRRGERAPVPEVREKVEPEVEAVALEPDTISLEEVEELQALVYGKPLTKSEIAAFTQEVEKAAAAGDRVAASLFETAASDLAAQARAPIEKLGLANRVVDDANLEAETMSFAKKLAAGPRVAWWHVKKNMKVAEEGSLSEALDSEAARMIRTGETEDHKEAARAFVEKRAPVFKGY